METQKVDLTPQSGLTVAEIEQNKRDYQEIAQQTSDNTLSTFYEIGAVTIPSIDLSMKITIGTSEVSISNGAGTTNTNQVMGEGNYALASHNYYYGFGKLKRVQLGDTVFLNDGQRTFEYRVTVSEEITKYESEVILPIEGQTLVTLITCNGQVGTDMRWLVQGSLV